MALVCSAHRTEINLLRQTLDRLIYHQQALDQPWTSSVSGSTGKPARLETNLGTT